MQLFLCDRGSEPFLIQELRRAFPRDAHRVQLPGLVCSEFLLQSEAPPLLVFAHQTLPDARAQVATSVKAWAELLATELERAILDAGPWWLHVVPHYTARSAGDNRCRLIEAALDELLRRQHRRLWKAKRAIPTSFDTDHSLVQLLLIAPEQAFLSIAIAPQPLALRSLVSPFPKGELPVARDLAAPSRAFAKLLEAEARLGIKIGPEETCVDLGAAPGSWSYVALQRGARVLAVDRSPLRPDVLSHARMSFKTGDAFQFAPPEKVDWLLCDVIAAPERSIELLLDWVRARRARRFVVTLKFKGTKQYGLLEHLKHALPPLCDTFYLTRLCANRNEVCAFGAVRETDLIPGGLD